MTDIDLKSRNHVTLTKKTLSARICKGPPTFSSSEGVGVRPLRYDASSSPDGSVWE